MIEQNSCLTGSGDGLWRRYAVCGLIGAAILLPVFASENNHLHSHPEAQPYVYVRDYLVQTTSGDSVAIVSSYRR